VNQTTYAVSGAGSAVAVGFGLVAQAASENSLAGNAALVVSACGVVTSVATLYFKDRSERRAERRLEERAQLAERELVATKERLAQLEGKADRVDANATKIAGVEGKADAAVEAIVSLRERGYFVSDETGHSATRPPPLLLIVEDDPPTAKALSTLFSRRGFKVDIAATVEDGLASLDEKPCWVILDLKLGGGDGIEILRRVRREGLEPRVAVTTGLDDPERIREVEDLVPDAIFRKPIPYRRLIETITPERPDGEAPC
jgi:CheY-like chemotaxis protein